MATQKFIYNITSDTFQFAFFIQGTPVNAVWSYSDNQGNSSSGTGLHSQENFIIGQANKNSDFRATLDFSFDSGLMVAELKNLYPGQINQNRFQGTTPISGRLITTVRFAVKETQSTYLETLDKLDQYSNAQYIPDLR